MLIFKDITALVARLLTGTVLIAHGWQKFNEWTIAGTTQAFEGMGVPAPGLSAPLAATIELVGGILILIGLGTRWVGVIVAALMAGAAFIAHVPNGIFVDAGGWELVGMIAAAGLALAASGAGRVSVDHIIASRRTPAA